MFSKAAACELRLLSTPAECTPSQAHNFTARPSKARYYIIIECTYKNLGNLCLWSSVFLCLTLHMMHALGMHRHSWCLEHQAVECASKQETCRCSS